MCDFVGVVLSLCLCLLIDKQSFYATGGSFGVCRSLLMLARQQVQHCHFSCQHSLRSDVARSATTQHHKHVNRIHASPPLSLWVHPVSVHTGTAHRYEGKPPTARTKMVWRSPKADFSSCIFHALCFVQLCRSGTLCKDIGMRIVSRTFMTHAKPHDTKPS